MAMERRTHLSEEMLTEILARLPLRSISRFKSVCKTWKSILESAYFRRLFLSVHRNSSSSWSLFEGAKELIGFHGCETWDLPKSPASLIPTSFKSYYRGCRYMASSSGLVLIAEASDQACYVGNPVLLQWVKIPPPSGHSFVYGLLYSFVFGLVTRVDEDGLVTSFKVIRFAADQRTNLPSTFSVFLYSSQTGIWTSKTIHCPCRVSDRSYFNLNGTIYFGCDSLLVSHDFYSDESDQFRVVQLPDHPGDDIGVRRTLTTSGGFVMCVTALADHKKETVLKIWRLNNDGESWQLLWEIGLPMIGEHAPIAMHPFDIGTVYLWSQQDHHVVSCNLRTRNYTILRDAYNDGHQDCFIDKSVDETWYPRSLSSRVITCFVPFVLPRWIESVPRPPQAEMIDTTSLQATMMRNIRNS